MQDCQDNCWTQESRIRVDKLTVIAPAPPGQGGGGEPGDGQVQGVSVRQCGDTDNYPLTSCHNQDAGIVFRFPINLLSIQLFVIIIEKGVKGFTLLKVIPLAYARYGI